MKLEDGNSETMHCGNYKVSKKVFPQGVRPGTDLNNCPHIFYILPRKFQHSRQENGFFSVRKTTTTNF